MHFILSRCPVNINYELLAVQYVARCLTFVGRITVTVWLDTRTAETVAEILARTPGHNQDHLRVRFGLICSYCQKSNKFLLSHLPLGVP